MLVRLSTAIAAICMLSGAALAQGAAKLTDPQIAHIAYTAGQLDIAGAKQAISRSTNKDVRAFAEDVVRDHTAVNKQALDLVHKLKVTPEANDTSNALTQQAAHKRAELSKLNGADFDKAYIANEVAYHQTVNGALETTLIPSASNPELKSLLQTGLKIFQGHQQHAEEVAAALKRDQLVGSQTQSQPAVNTKIQALNSEKDQLAGQIAQAQSAAKIQELNSEKDQLAGQIAQARSAIETAERKLVDATTQVQELTKEKDGLVADNERAQAQVDVLRDNLRALDGESIFRFIQRRYFSQK
jgi:putative membrane protein